MNRNFFSYFILISFLFIFVIPTLKDGIFIDGLLYANISKNLSTGIGNFWNPFYSLSDSPFTDHPPLVFWVQSFFFTIFGKWGYKVFSIFVLVSTVFLFYKILNRVTGKNSKVFVILLLFWLLSEEVRLRYPSNMLECSIGLISLLYMYIFLRLKEAFMFWAISLAAVFAFIGFLSKGPVALFILSIPSIGIAVSSRKLLVPILIQIYTFFLFSVIFGVLVYLSSEAYYFFDTYFNDQILKSIGGHRAENLQTTRFAILRALFLKNLACWLFLLTIFFFSWKHKWGCKIENLNEGVFLILVGLSAILPIMLSIKQAAYYQIPGFNFIALGIGVILYQYFEKVYNIGFVLYGKIKTLLISSLAFSFFFLFFTINSPKKRDAVVLDEVRKIAKEVTNRGASEINIEILSSLNLSKKTFAYFNHSGYLNLFENIVTNDKDILNLKLVIHDGIKVPYDDCLKPILILEKSNLYINSCP